MHTLTIHIHSDFVCPWCWIGYQNLRLAIAQTSMQKVVKLVFLPYELNPHAPVKGMDRREYRSRKFGSWQAALEKDRQVTHAGQVAGLQFNLDKIQRTPNTRLAHRLMHYIQECAIQGSNTSTDVGANDASLAEKLYQAIFSAYFQAGQDIGKVDVLTELAALHGSNRQAVSEFLAASVATQEVLNAERDAQLAGISAVPAYAIQGHRLSGAQPVSVFTEVLLSQLHIGF